MEKFIEEALLYDFYGELLTEHQKLIYEDFVLNDLSLSEIAEDREIRYEAKLHLVAKFIHTKERVAEINHYANEILEHQEDHQRMIECINRIEMLSNTIVEEL